MTKEEFKQVVEWIAEEKCEYNLGGVWTEFQESRARASTTFNITNPFEWYRRTPEPSKAPSKRYDANNLSLRDALEITRDMWTWLAENPTKWKFEWPGWGMCRAHRFCFACDYWQDNVGNWLCYEHCLLKKLWPNGCLDPGSPYKLKQAKVIAEFSKAEYLKTFNTRGKKNER